MFALKDALDLALDDRPRPRIMPLTLSSRVLNIRIRLWARIGIQKGIAAEGFSELEIVEHVRIELLVLAIEERRQLPGIIGPEPEAHQRLCRSQDRLPRFVLQTLDGRRVTNDDLRGRVAVINFWGIWCVHCVAELPEYAALARNYRADRDVMVLTINNDNDAAKVRRWMAANHYDFPVLLDDGWLASSQLVTTFPTTWFLDSKGNLAFAKIGETKNLVEEFTWRVEDLRGRTR